ncbi:MAG: hypothetical protein PHG47_06975 [Sulfuricella sp.]|nr:hypothetical protein [Sulfuricella sp.]
MLSFRSAVIALALFTFTAIAQSASPDLANDALVSTFQRDSGNVLCSPKNATLKEMRALLDPYIKDIDLANPNSYPALAVAVYTAFPCPFSPLRPELRPAAKEDLIGSWLFPDASLRLRHGPKSPAWRETPGMPYIKCEGLTFHETGEYRVAQIRGQLACPTEIDMQAMRSLPKVSSWILLPNGRVKIARTDVPTQTEEWEVYAVQTPFEFFSIKFAVGDLVVYLRRHLGNEINAATTFRHLQPLK